MKQVSPSLIGLIAAGAILFGATSAIVIIALNTKRQPVLYRCDKENLVEYILASGSEYMIVNPSDSRSRNSFLISREANTNHRDWLFYGIPTTSADTKGFALRASEQYPYIHSLTFDANQRKLNIKYGKDGKREKKLLCSQSSDYSRVIEAANNVPVEYILTRNSPLPFLNPRLGEKSFNISLYNAIKLKRHSEYAQYQLLSGLPESQLSAGQKALIGDLKRKLIQANSSQASVWEFSGSYRYSWEYLNEKGEAHDNAGNWCRSQQYYNVDDYTKAGFKIISTQANMLSTNGWVRQDYPDGRFSGYVNYKADCDGITYSLTKEGSVDSESENTYSQYD
jgi:hypothetical protein